MPTDHYAKQDRRAAEIWGWRPSEARPCPRLVAGNHCLAGHSDHCVCLEHWDVFDHTRIWLDKNGNHVFTTEPYNRDGSHVATFIEAMEDLGLRVTITGRSNWNPGSTFMLIVDKEDREPHSPEPEEVVTEEVDSTRQNVTKLLRGLESDGLVYQDGERGPWKRQQLEQQDNTGVVELSKLSGFPEEVS